MRSTQTGWKDGSISTEMSFTKKGEMKIRNRFLVATAVGVIVADAALKVA